MADKYPCSICGMLISPNLRGTLHVKGTRCCARQLAHKLSAEGLVAVAPTVTSVQHIEAALVLFGFPYRRESTKIASPRGTPTKADQCWTTPEAAAVAQVIDHTANFLHCTYPEAARRLHEHQNLIPQLVTITALGGAPAKTMYKLLHEIDYKGELSGKRTYGWARDNWSPHDRWGRRGW